MMSNASIRKRRRTRRRLAATRSRLARVRAAWVMTDRMLSDAQSMFRAAVTL